MDSEKQSVVVFLYGILCWIKDNAVALCCHWLPSEWGHLRKACRTNLRGLLGQREPSAASGDRGKEEKVDPNGKAPCSEGDDLGACVYRAAQDNASGASCILESLCPDSDVSCCGAFFRVFLLYFVVWSSIFLLFQGVDPFGLNSLTDAYGERLLAKATAPLYNSAVQDDLVVVLIDDETLQATGQEWPLEYASMAELVKRLVVARPKAVFLDIEFRRRRPYDQSFERAMRDLRVELADFAVPVFVAQGRPGERSLLQGLPHVRPVVSAWETQGYPLIQDAQGLHQPSAAYALYQAVTGQRLPAQEHRPMAIQWGMGLSAFGAGLPFGQSQDCAFIEPDGWARYGQTLTISWNLLVHTAFPGVMEEMRQRCPYTPTLSAVHLDDPGYNRLLSGKTVLVGADLAALGDWVVTPMHGKMPGVYLHAMALDNLLTYHDNYIKLDAKGFGEVWALPAAFLALIALGFSLLRVRYGRHWGLLAMLRNGAVLFLGVATMVMVSHLGCRLAPHNWLGFLAVVGITSGYIFIPTHKDGK